MKNILQTTTDLCKEIPEYDHFFTTAELQEKAKTLEEVYPDRVTVRQIGRTARGTSIEMTEIGDLSRAGGRSLLLKGIVHPNEAISTLTTDFLSGQFAAHSEILEALGYDRALVVGVADPDGYAMQGWAGQEFSAESYVKGFYRPPGSHQVDAGYPYDYKRLRCKGLPESLVVARIIEETRPDFMAALHNSAIGRPYLYIQQQPLPFAHAMRAWMDYCDLQPETDSIESSFVTQWAPGLYASWPIERRYDTLEAEGKDPLKYILNGGGSRDFLARVQPRALHLATELPYFTCAALDDARPAEVYLSDAITEGRKRRLALLAFIKQNLDDLAKNERLIDHPLFEATAYQYNLISNYMGLDSGEKDTTEATVGQAFNARYGGAFYSLTQIGQLGRLARDYDDSARADRLHEVIDTGLAEMDAAGGRIEVTPMRELALAQIGFTLIAAGLAAKSE